MIMANIACKSMRVDLKLLKALKRLVDWVT